MSRLLIQPPKEGRKRAGEWLAASWAAAKNHSSEETHSRLGSSFCGPKQCRQQAGVKLPRTCKIPGGVSPPPFQGMGF